MVQRKDFFVGLLLSKRGLNCVGFESDDLDLIHRFVDSRLDEIKTDSQLKFDLKANDLWCHFDLKILNTFPYVQKI